MSVCLSWTSHICRNKESKCLMTRWECISVQQPYFESIPIQPRVKNVPFPTDQLCRCRGQNTLVSEANWSPYLYQRSTVTTKREWSNVQSARRASWSCVGITLASNKGNATANISVTRVRSSSWVFFSFAVRTCSMHKNTSRISQSKCP